MSLLGLKDTFDGLARASGVRLYGHVLRRDNDKVLGRAVGFLIGGKKRAWTTEYDVKKAS